MAIKKSGSLSLDDIVAEFGSKSSDVCLDDYYRGNGLVPNTLRNKSISVYKQDLSLDMFYNTSRYNGYVNITVHDNISDVDRGSITVLCKGTSVVWKFCIQPANHYVVAIPNKENIASWNTGSLDIGWHLIGVWDESDWSYYGCYIADDCSKSYILGKEYPTTDWFVKVNPEELMIEL